MESAIALLLISSFLQVFLSTYREELSVLSLQKKLFLVGTLCLGFILMARAIPVRAETIQVEGGLAVSGEFTGSSMGTETADPGEKTFTTFSITPSDQLISSETAFQTLPSLIGGNSPSEQGTFPPGFPPTITDPPGGGGGGGSGGGG